MKSREISRPKIGPFSLACTDPYIDIGLENQSTTKKAQLHNIAVSEICISLKINILFFLPFENNIIKSVSYEIIQYNQ